MDPEIKAIKKALQQRQAELEQLIDQMRSDELSRSSVFRSLKEELSNIMLKLEGAISPLKK